MGLEDLTVGQAQLSLERKCSGLKCPSGFEVVDEASDLLGGASYLTLRVVEGQLRLNAKYRLRLTLLSYVITGEDYPDTRIVSEKLKGQPRLPRSNGGLKFTPRVDSTSTLMLSRWVTLRSSDDTIPCPPLETEGRAVSEITVVGVSCEDAQR